ncbi:ribosome silencing factor [Acidaminobacter sp. JC074]|uniref:ribosome silencing factor n=1 Tax=Acidaminobacter sp. JC074 TaxID=2530199 RepID=UPI001F0F5642|nr:ribosome silencing factor [Acidaminobacter sp. JC074]MCH4886671.1 ribosome silencing factor [Acidaminobacter sp. JC074]
MDNKSLSLEVFKALDDKKAHDIKVLDVKGITSVADYFVIATGTSTKHASSLAESVEEALGEIGLNVSHKEGYRTGEWILLDYLDVVVHVFTNETREFYKLEKMWKDAEILEVSVDTY